MDTLSFFRLLSFMASFASNLLLVLVFLTFLLVDDQLNAGPRYVIVCCLCSVLKIIFFFFPSSRPIKNYVIYIHVKSYIYK